MDKVVKVAETEKPKDESVFVLQNISGKEKEPSEEEVSRMLPPENRREIQEIREEIIKTLDRVRGINERCEILEECIKNALRNQDDELVADSLNEIANLLDNGSREKEYFESLREEFLVKIKPKFN